MNKYVVTVLLVILLLAALQVKLWDDVVTTGVFWKRCIGRIVVPLLRVSENDRFSEWQSLTLRAFPDVRVTGRPISTPCIYMSYHHNMGRLDIMGLAFLQTGNANVHVVAVGLRPPAANPLNYMVKKQWLKVLHGHEIRVEYGQSNYETCLRGCERVVKLGGQVCGFPEGWSADRRGWRNRYKLSSFKSGLFKIAFQLNIPVVFYMTDPCKHNPRLPYFGVRDVPWRVAFGPVTYPSRFDTWELLRDATRVQMQDQLHSWESQPLS